jgi:signal transduction histidine kinase
LHDSGVDGNFDGEGKFDMGLTGVDGCGVLVVDDSPANLELMSDLLAGEGYWVRSAGSGQEALDLVEAFPPDLILLDIRMPGMDGFDVLRCLRVSPKSQDIPVVFLSASSDAAERIQGLRLGAVDFINKPFKIEEVRARICTHLEMSRLRTRLRSQAEDLLGANERLLAEVNERRRVETSLLDDVAERARHAQSLREKNAELERFCYLVSHDLKSPALTIEAFSGFLELDLANGDLAKVQTDIGFIRKAANKVSRMQVELLEISRAGRVQSAEETVSLRDLVDEAKGLVAGQASVRGVIIDIPVEPLELVGDRPRLVGVFQNLLDNAIKFLGDQPAPRIEVGFERQGTDTVLFVRDNGRGIESRHLDEIFGLFKRLDTNTDGTGLGLSLVRSIVESHGGRIWAESEGLGMGATFRFTLPTRARTGHVPSRKDA